jgi:hypothetical protein
MFFLLSPRQFADEALLEKYKTLANSPEATKSLKLKVTDEIERIELYLKGQEVYLKSKMASQKAKA